MKRTLKRSAIALALAPALALPAAAVYAQGQQQDRMQQQQQRQAQGRQDLRNWDAARLYRNGWSAEEMIGTDVRGQNGEEIGEVKDIIVGRDGSINRVVVEVGGFLEMGDQHIGVPWKDVRVGRDMQWIQVPLREVENGTYSLYGRIPQGEDVRAAQGAWRVNELIGDYASLFDVPRYGIVTDVIFNDQGKAQGIIVNRTAGTWGGAGWYGYPYSGYYPGAYGYPLPYESADVGDYGRFNYVQFAQQSDMASEQNPRVKQYQVQVQRMQQQRGGSATSGGGSGQRSQDQLSSRSQRDDAFARADRDNDRRLDRQEFDAALDMRQGGSASGGGSAQRSQRQDAFARADDDNNQRLDRQRYQEALQMRQGNQDAFARADRDNDQRLDRSEFESALQMRGR